MSLRSSRRSGAETLVLTRTVSRLVTLASIAVLALPFPANSEPPEELNVGVDAGPVAMTRYSADRAGVPPHGSKFSM